ncbi:DUF1990 family protein [Microbacterium luteum]|uniref:DUF1990 family protein n=1 Tax=Microbacterium luteum TaxID=2782167 RepID=UPI001E314D3A|nr:DUF1990 family protein [Microbacterium luteum]
MVDIGSGSLTQVSEAKWRERPAGYRAWERSTDIGGGEQFWDWATFEVLRWGVKTRSGFTVTPDQRVSPGDRPVINAHPFGLSIREPVEVVDVVDTDTRVGFAYRTLPLHPVSGEEAFIIERAGDKVTLTIRSLTRERDLAVASCLPAPARGASVRPPPIPARPPQSRAVSGGATCEVRWRSPPCI